MTYDYKHFLSEGQFRFLKEVLVGLGGDSFSLKLSPGLKDSANFAGNIIDAVVEWSNNGKMSMSNFIIKAIPSSKILLSLVPIEATYEREIYIYSNVFPEFEKFQSQRNVKTYFKSYPVFYKTVTESQEMLVLENLRKKGFRHVPREQPLDYNHTVTVIKEYARLHALSYAIRDQNPKLFEKWSKNTTNHFHLFDNISVRDTCLHRANAGLKSLNPVHDQLIYEKFSNYVKNFIPIHNNLMYQSNKYAVISHIDTGLHNLLFKYKEKSSIPTDVSILDWQQCRLESPAVDLITFLFSVSDKILRNRYNNLIVEYYQTLSLFLKELGSDVEELLPFQILQEQLKMYGILGLHFAIMLIYVYLTPNVPTVSDDDCHKDGFAFIYELEDRSEFDQRVRDVIIDFDKLGYNFCLHNSK